MILYHGSNVEVRIPDLSYSKPFKDFGRGFYLSAEIRQAQRLAEQRTQMLKKGIATVSSYYFDENLLTGEELKVKLFLEYSEEWAEFVAMNRNTELEHPVHDYDIVYGPIADDGVTFQLRRYQAGSITMKELIEELKYSQGITFQYYFGSELALSKLKCA